MLEDRLLAPPQQVVNGSLLHLSHAVGSMLQPAPDHPQIAFRVSGKLYLVWRLPNQVVVDHHRQTQQDKLQIEV